MPDRHARLSASASGRWISCPPSLMMEEKMNKKGDTAFTREGTVAHSLAEILIRYSNGLMNEQSYLNHFHLIEREAEYSEEMLDYMIEYSDWVTETFNSVKSKCSDAILLTEQRLDYSRWAEGGFGTGDVIIIAEPEMIVIDLKYGKGVPVSAENNSQLKLYGLGAVEKYDIAYDIERVQTIINQPRLNSISSAEYTVDELIAWGERIVHPAAEMALKGKGELSAGDHCRFCKALPVCRAWAEKAAEAAAHDFCEPNELEDSEIEEMLAIADPLKKWLDSLSGYALDKALDGHRWENFKVVEGRSNRKYKDELEASKALTDAGYDETILYERKFLTITNLEKAIGKKMVKELLEDEGHIIKPEGKPTLVPRSDKRRELDPGADFKEESEE